MVERARGGTLFLDELGELSADAQAQLLRFVQDKTYRWLGDDRDRRAPSVRLVAATHVDLQAAVEAGTFRADLFFRLAVFPIAVPALADRREDLPYLAHNLVERAAQDYGVTSLPVSDSALLWLEGRDWPGQIRELDNVLRAGLLWATADRSSAVLPHHLDRDQAPPAAEPQSFTDAVRAFKRRYVARAVAAEGGNKSRAAERLGIHRSSLYELLSGDDDG